MATTAQRQHIAAVTHELNARKSQLLYPPDDVRKPQDAYDWHLTEHQAMTVLHAGHTLMWDCSEAYSWVLKCAGLWRLSYPGYTGTDLAVCQPHYTNPKDALIGAGVVFGPGTGHHVGWVIEPDPKDPLLASHGRPGFDLVRLSALAASQAAEGYPGVTFISIQHL